MLILEYAKYNDFISNKKFMEYFNSMKKRILELFPAYEVNLELLLENVYLLYYEKFSIDDAINNLYLNGYLFNFTTVFDGN